MKMKVVKKSKTMSYKYIYIYMYIYISEVEKSQMCVYIHMCVCVCVCVCVFMENNQSIKKNNVQDTKISKEPSIAQEQNSIECTCYREDGKKESREKGLKE